MKLHTKPSSPKKAFSLIELSVVLIIIAALLVAVFGGGSKMLRYAKCSSIFGSNSTTTALLSANSSEAVSAATKTRSAGFDNCINISLPVKPNEISNLEFWVDASDASKIITSSGFVSQWTDKSGKGKNATQGGTKPTYVRNCAKITCPSNQALQRDFISSFNFFKG